MRNLKLLEKKIVKNIPGISEALFLTFDIDGGVGYAASRSQIIAFSPSTGEVCIKLRFRANNLY